LLLHWDFCFLFFLEPGDKMDKFQFENQREDEEVILLRKRHPWVLAKPGFIFIFLLLLILTSFLIWGASRISMIILALLGIVILSYGLNVWFVYVNGIYILTNQRLICIDQKSVFQRTVSEAELENIQNITSDVNGVIGNLLKIGRIKISTAGNTVGLEIRDVNDPYFVHEKIIDQQRQFKKNKDSHLIRQSNVIR
jgi:hypothetical protein